MMPYLFNTERIGFRQWLDRDIEPFVAMCQDERVMEFFPSILQPEETLASIERQKTHIVEHGFGFFAVDELSTSRFMGFIGIVHPRFESYFTPCVEIGWRLHSDFWGKGYATEGAKKCLEYGFETLKIPEIYSFTTLSNKRSERVMQKIGMTQIGTFEHPSVPENHPFRPHLLYHIQNHVL
jgi:RimJ/RimL family protein N-acetyltransferase